MLRWFHALMPQEERFFELFARHSDVVVAGAKALREMLEGGDAVARHYKAVMDREQDADNITREVLIAVRRSFITPFDRGDVKDLITSMDNAIDQMQKTAKTIMLFDQRTFTPQQKEMADAIVKAAVLVQEAIPLLSVDQHQCRAHQPDQRADFADRGPGRRAARPRAAGTLSRQPAVELDGVLHRRRDLRSSRKSGRSFRRRRQRYPRHRARECVSCHPCRR